MLSSDTWLGARGGMLFLRRRILKLKKKKKKRSDRNTASEREKKGRDGRENLSFKSEAMGAIPLPPFLIQHNIQSHSFTPPFPCISHYSSPLPMLPQPHPRPPPWWLDGSLNGHSIPIRQHSGSSLGCRVLNGGGNGYIRRLRRALHRR